MAVTRTIESPVGPLTLIATERGLRGLHFAGEQPDRVEWPDADEDVGDPVIAAVETQLGEYFAGERTQFDIPLDLVGTPFQVTAWTALADIPYGETVSYGEQARRIGKAGAARAVGAANGRNPVAIVLPCHRVIGADGSLTGFGGGIDTKRALLDLEERFRDA